MVSSSAVVPFVLLSFCHLCAFAQPNFCDDYACYKPGPQVKRWTQGDFTGNDDAQGYGQDVAQRAIVLAAVAAVLIFCLLCWYEGGPRMNE
jgi:hypothetical protein